MPTPRKTNPTPNGPAKKAAPKRTRKAPAEAPVGIAAKRARARAEDGQAADPYALTGWAPTTSQGTLQDLQLPSGQLVLAQRPRPEDLLIAGLLEDLDMLAGLLPDGSGKRKTVDNAKLNAISKSPKGLAQAMTLMDRVVVHVVIKPELTPEPEDPRDKVIGCIYPSSIGLEDKVFLFNWAVGGTQDLARFREQFSESVANVAAVEDVEHPAE